jgi:hypothetical protein
MKKEPIIFLALKIIKFYLNETFSEDSKYQFPCSEVLIFKNPNFFSFKLPGLKISVFPKDNLG